MRLVQVISDYIRRSILTTQGDLVVRGATIPERLVAGAVNTFLTGQGAGNIPTFEPATFGALPIAGGIFSRTSSGVHTISGLGFEPRLIYFQARDEPMGPPNISLSVVTQDFVYLIGLRDGGTKAMTAVTHACQIRRSPGNILYGIVTDFNSDGFEVTFTLSGTAGVRVQWVAVG